MNKKLGAALLALLILLGALPLSGCSIESGDGLASLPKLPGEYLALQKKLDAILAQGYTYAVAESGPDRQAVQLQDIDGDGVTEIVSFFRNVTSGEYAVYLHKRQGEDYVELGKATGYGKYLRQVSYPRCQSNGSRAIVLSWGMADNSSYGMSVYTLGRDGFSDALGIQYNNYIITDINADGVDEIVTTFFDRVAGSMTLTSYGFSQGQCEPLSQAPLSADVKNVVRISRGRDAAGVVLYVDSLSESGGYITDIIGQENGTLVNTTLGGDGKRSAATWRPVSILCKDIDGDGLPEVPLAEMLPGYQDPSSTDTRWKIRWAKFANGDMTGVAVTTFHSPAEDWYMRWPEKWADQVSAIKRNEAGIIKTTFLVPTKSSKGENYLLAADNNVVLNLWVFTGDNRQDHFNTSGMRFLKNGDNMIYGYSVPENDYPQLVLSEDEILQLFSTIGKEWGWEVYS